MKITQDRHSIKIYPHVDQDEELKGFEGYLNVSFNTLSAPSHILIGGISQFPQSSEATTDHGLAAIQAALMGEQLALDFIKARKPIHEDEDRAIQGILSDVAEWVESIKIALEALADIRSRLLISRLAQFELDHMASTHPAPAPKKSDPPPPPSAAQKMLDKLQQEL